MCMILGTIKMITRRMMMIDLIVARACARFRLAALQRWHILLRAHHHYHQHQHQHQQRFYATLLLWCAWIIQSMTLPQFWFWNSWNVQCEIIALEETYSILMFDFWNIIYIVNEHLERNLIADKKTKPLCRCLALSTSPATPSSLDGYQW